MKNFNEIAEICTKNGYEANVIEDDYYGEVVKVRDCQEDIFYYIYEEDDYLYYDIKLKQTPNGLISCCWLEPINEFADMFNNNIMED